MEKFLFQYNFDCRDFFISDLIALSVPWSLDFDDEKSITKMWKINTFSKEITLSVLNIQNFGKNLFSLLIDYWQMKSYPIFAKAISLHILESYICLLHQMLIVL